ncbi:MAG: molybdenum cofactor guanylyltransferase [Magnetococcus sp. DMHC-6]
MPTPFISPIYSPNAITGAILAGGLGRRFNSQDKAFLPLGEKPLIAHVLDRLTPQTATLIINANGDLERFRGYALPVLADQRPQFLGPLAGIETILAAVSTPWVLTVPVDTPFIPHQLACKLLHSMGEKPRPVTVSSQERIHYAVCLWPKDLLPEISKALDDGALQLKEWFAKHDHGILNFPLDDQNRDPFFNINTYQELEIAQYFAQQDNLKEVTS